MEGRMHAAELDDWGARLGGGMLASAALRGVPASRPACARACAPRPCITLSAHTAASPATGTLHGGRACGRGGHGGGASRAGSRGGVRDIQRQGRYPEGRCNPKAA